MTKEERIQRASNLLEKIHGSAQEQEQSLLAIGRNSYAALTEECLTLLTKLSAIIDDPELQSKGYIPEEADIFSLERKYAGLQGLSRKILIVAGVILFIIVSVLLYFYGGNIQDSLNKTFGAKETSKYIFLGIGGAIVYFVTESFTKSDGGNPLQGGGISFQTLIAQIAYALIIPVVVVVLFVSNPGSDNSASGTATVAASKDWAALFSFASGYSSKLVVMLLNKIVEKGEQIIKTL